MEREAIRPLAIAASEIKPFISLDGLHQRGDKRHIAGEPVELRHYESRLRQPSVAQGLRQLGSIRVLAGLDLCILSNDHAALRGNQGFHVPLLSLKAKAGFALPLGANPVVKDIAEHGHGWFS